MDLLSVLSPASVPPALVHAAGRAGSLGDPGKGGSPAETMDGALGRLARVSLLTFSVDGATVIAHRLVMRVIRDQLARAGRLDAVCEAAAQLLDSSAAAFGKTLHSQRAAARGLVEQIMALHTSCARETEDGELVRSMMRLRLWAAWILTELGDSAQQAILIGEPLLADQERVLGADDPDTLATRNNLANAYQDAGRAADAIPLYELTLADRERVLGADHPDTLASRNNLGEAYRAAGRAADAVALHEQTLADIKRVLGADDPDTLASRNNLAEAYRAAGRAADAIALHERTLADCSGSWAPTTPTPWPRGTISPTPTGTRAGPPTRSRCTSGPSPTGSGSWAPTTPTPWPRGTTSARITGRRAGSPTRSRCTSGPSPTGSGSWAPTTPTPWPRGTTSPWPTRRPVGLPKPKQYESARSQGREWLSFSWCTASLGAGA